MSENIAPTIFTLLAAGVVASCMADGAVTVEPSARPAKTVEAVATPTSTPTVTPSGTPTKTATPVPVTTSAKTSSKVTPAKTATIATNPAMVKLGALPVKGRAPATGYARAEFPHWTRAGGCDTADAAISKAATGVITLDGCDVQHALINDRYGDQIVEYTKGVRSVQVDHVVSLKNAWVTGAQKLTREQRRALANDQQNLIATSAKLNQQKGASDAASWLPPNKKYRCEYITRQITIKARYGLWVTPPEKVAMENVLKKCG